MLKLFAGLALACLVTPVYAQSAPTCQSISDVRDMVKALGAAASIVEIPPKSLIGSDVVGIKTIVFVTSPQGLVFGVEGDDGCMSAPMLLGPLAGADGKPVVQGSGLEIGT